ncbi:hypothetical protein GCM10010349_23050 [Streptomyces flavofungini]|nr:hypothetical protein GCM10010349_23050 [Streptomyces flavofungini]
MTRVDDPQPETDATTAESEEHQHEKGRQKSKSAQAAWQRHADALDARLAELESREKREPRRDVVPTGRTYADDWHQGGTAARRARLIDAGARLMVKPGGKGGWRRLDLRRVDFTVTGELDPAIAELATVAADAEAEARNRPDRSSPARASHAHLTQSVAVRGTGPANGHRPPRRSRVRRRAKRHDAAARLRRRIQERGHAWCDWCLGDFTADAVDVDLVRPLAMGGTDTGGNGVRGSSCTVLATVRKSWGGHAGMRTVLNLAISC